MSPRWPADGRLVRLAEFNKVPSSSSQPIESATESARPPVSLAGAWLVSCEKCSPGLLGRAGGRTLQTTAAEDEDDRRGISPGQSSWPLRGQDELLQGELVLP